MDLKKIFQENPVLVGITGLCPAVAVTTTVMNSLVLGLGTLFVLLGTGLVSNLLKKWIPARLAVWFHILIAAGLTTLRLISRPGFHAELSDYTTRLLDGLQQRADAAGIPFVTTQAGGMFGLYFSGADDIVTFDDVMASDADLFKRFFHLMLEGGVYLAPSAFEAGFTSIAHGEAELQLTLDAAERAFAALK